MNRKKLMIVALIAALALALAACAPKAPAPTAAPQVTEAPAAEATPETLADQAAEVVAAAETAVEGAVDQAQAAGQAVAEEVKETAEEAKETVAAAADALADKAEEAVEGAVDQAQAVAAEVKETAEEAKETVTEAAAAVSGALEGEEKPLLLSLEELKAFNGKNGSRAYVAVDGIIYDMTDSAMWKEGSHNGFEAGQDLTDAIKEKSPHGVAKLANVKEVGRLKVELTLEELKEFNGKDGKPAYVAVDGIIYDVTASALWQNGSHNGFEAGQDLTDAIKEKSPHGVAKLANVVEIGVVKE